MRPEPQIQRRPGGRTCAQPPRVRLKACDERDCCRERESGSPPELDPSPLASQDLAGHKRDQHQLGQHLSAVEIEAAVTVDPGPEQHGEQQAERGRERDGRSLAPAPDPQRRSDHAGDEQPPDPQREVGQRYRQSGEVTDRRTDHRHELSKAVVEALADRREPERVGEAGDPGVHQRKDERRSDCDRGDRGRPAPREGQQRATPDQDGNDE